MRVCWLPPRCRWDLRSSKILRRPLDPWRCDRKVVPKRRYGITSVCCVKFQQSSDLVKLKPRYTPQNSEFLCLHPYCVPLCPVPTQCLRFTACVATYVFQRLCSAIHTGWAHPLEIFYYKVYKQRLYLCTPDIYSRSFLHHLGLLYSLHT